jgi:hypothetical protein
MKLKIKVRKTWGDTKPITKRIESAKLYKRKSKYGTDYGWGDLS